MNGLYEIEAIRKYCDYIEEHLMNVEEAWARLRESCGSMRFIYDDFVFWTIEGMMRGHDKSKTGSDEFTQYAEWFFGKYGKDYTPEENDDGIGAALHELAKDGFDKAWKHHKENNLHHWQSWTALEVVHHPYEKECHCVCMVADWMAMGVKFGDTAEEYYEAHKSEVKLPEWAVTFIGEIFEALRVHKESIKK